MFDRTALAALSAVLDTGSFDAAAQKLHMSQSAISQRIKKLEDDVGAILVRRIRPATATEAGRKLQAHAETINLLERDVAQAMGRTPKALDRPLRIVVTADSLASWVLPALPREAQLFYDLVIDDQDHSAALLMRGEVAAAITSRAVALTSCDVIALGPLRYAAFAAPEFVATHFPDGVTAEALGTAPALTFNRKDALQLNWASKVAGRKITVLPTHFLPSTHGITEAARVGLGWAVNPLPLVQPLFDNGDLIRLRPDIALDTPLYWQVPRQNKQALAKLTKSLVSYTRRLV
ncbi:LysR family transcriptional regulator ArgP [Cognatiyoonia sp. IB215182]|uniref:LysR family transcriptional regulator ArgP n=1 Tax=Cognatiyoonia sp. IB215182 TaxID=3097353 RepID=UPI002A0F3792|nr:LysR family transcriptional regulator ArgP [Cognatiyoonia sp. IB215182]MDX8354080.1 LysR family transcriptional regulator ArgP [Cognatiyoonia sp. IB215182]